MRIAKGVIMLLVLGLLFTAFEKKAPKSQGQLMTEYIDGEIAKKRSEEWQKCFKKTVKDAEQFVDSIIYQQVNFSISDSLKAPGKPIKPSKPYDTLKLDTTPIVPIIKKQG